jgi:hypothetical protein
MIFTLIFCLLNLAQPSGDRPVPHMIFEMEFDENWTVHHATLYGSVYYLEDVGSLSAEQAYEKFIDGQFTRIPKRAKFNKGYQTADWWFGITIENITEKDQIYYLAPFNAAIYKVNFFEFDVQGNLVDTDSSGYSIPALLGKTNARNDATPVLLSPKTKKIFLMKIDFNGGRSGTVFFLPNSFFSVMDDVWRAYYLGHFTGIYSAAVCISILAFLFFRKKVFLYLFAYSFCGLIIGLDYDRILWVILGNEIYTLIGSWIFPVTVQLLTLFILLFSRDIFRVYGKRVKEIPGLTIFINLQIAFVLLLIGSHFIFEPKQLVFYYRLCHYLGFH